MEMLPRIVWSFSQSTWPKKTVWFSFQTCKHTQTEAEVPNQIKPIIIIILNINKSGF